MSLLSRPVLILNKSWIPIRTSTVKESLIMCFGSYFDEKNNKQPRAKILDVNTWQTHFWESWIEQKPKEDDLCIHGALGQQIIIPEIVIAGRYNKVPKHRLNYSRKNIYLRDANRCQYCSQTFKDKELSLDHVVPKSKGGTSSWENIVLCCVYCNQKKADKLLEECGMKLIRMPSKPSIEMFGFGNHDIKSWKIFFNK